jgi:hypothetical protein
MHSAASPSLFFLLLRKHLEVYQFAFLRPLIELFTYQIGLSSIEREAGLKYSQTHIENSIGNQFSQ